MGQAVDEVRAAADDVTASVHDDGVAVELDRWFRDGPSSLGPSSTQGFP
jgi:hydroxymethylpyrimidine pyrophosphatase-like HAD family hydrolase